jgi:hypothetical protein
VITGASKPHGRSRCRDRAPAGDTQAAESVWISRFASENYNYVIKLLALQSAGVDPRSAPWSTAVIRKVSMQSSRRLRTFLFWDRQRPQPAGDDRPA